MKNIPLLIGTIVGTLILIVGIAFVFSNSSNDNAQPEVGQVENAAGDMRHVIGATESAKVTIVEFSDFQCPACQATAPVIKQVVSEYQEEVEFVYRHFPLQSIHPFALPAAVAAEAAAEFDRFFTYHDVLFARQDEWSKVQSLDAARELFADYAEELGIDRAEFQEKIQSDEIRQRVQLDIDAGNDIGINSTPTIFVNNQRVPAPHQLQSAVETVLNSQ